jgi:hypothetical protein
MVGQDFALYVAIFFVVVMSTRVIWVRWFKPRYPFNRRKHDRS